MYFFIEMIYNKSMEEMEQPSPLNLFFRKVAHYKLWAVLLIVVLAVGGFWLYGQLIPRAEDLVLEEDRGVSESLPEAGGLRALSGTLISIDETQNIITLNTFDPATLTIVTQSFEVSDTTLLSLRNIQSGEVSDSEKATFDNLSVGESITIFYPRDEVDAAIPSAIEIEVQTFIDIKPGPPPPL